MAKQITPINPKDPGFHLLFITNGHRMIFGFGKTLFVSPVTGSRYKFSYYGDDNFKVETVGNSEPAEFADLLIAVREETSSSNPSYYFKKYAWDTEDLTQIDPEELRVSDILEVHGQFFLIINLVKDGFEIISTEGIKAYTTFKMLPGNGFTFYRAKSL